MKLIRSHETSGRRNKRLQSERQRMYESRNNESEENINERLTYHERTEFETNGKRRLNNKKNKKSIAKSFKVMNGFHYSSTENYKDSPEVTIGNMDILCSFCFALRYKYEPPGLCCNNGKVKLPNLTSPPEPLHSLLLGDTQESKHFLRNIRKYNSAFQMTSFGAKKEIEEPGFMPTFKIQGQVYHRICSILPMSNSNHQFLQVYFMGEHSKEINQECVIMPDIRKEIVEQLQHLLYEHNRYISFFKTALEKMPNDEYKIIIHADKTPKGDHRGRFNAPTTDEVAVIMVGSEYEKRDIILEKKNNTLKRVTETHRSYDALQYPIIYWQGEDGYNFGILSQKLLAFGCHLEG